MVKGRKAGSPVSALEEQKFRLLRKYQRAKQMGFTALSGGRMEEGLIFASAAANLAWRYHLGVWADEELEGLASAISDRLFDPAVEKPPESAPSGRRKVLYLATFLDPVGGHSEVLRLWTKLLSVRETIDQHVVTTTERHGQIREARLRTGVDVARLTRQGFVNAVYELVEMILEIGPDDVVLFINPDDVVALTALHFVKKVLNPRVLFYNHVDNGFWLGRRVIDVLIDFSPERAAMSRTLRGLSCPIAVVPLTTDVHETEGGPRVESRERAFTVSLSMGTAWKIVPDGSWDYFEAIREILQRNPSHRHVLITTASSSISRSLSHWKRELLDRLTVRLAVADPRPYYAEADFLIETFPFCGGQVRIEAMALGLPVILVRNRKFSLTFSHSGAEMAVGLYPFYAESNADVVEHATTLIRDADLRRRYGGFLGSVFLTGFSPQQVATSLEALFTGRAASAGGTGDAGGQEEAVVVDDDYLFACDLLRPQSPSPFLATLVDQLHRGRLTISTVIRLLPFLTMDDLAWISRWPLRVLRRFVGGESRLLEPW